MGKSTLRITTLAVVVGATMMADTATASESRPARIPIVIDTGSPDSVVVRPGDHLWKISARHLQEVRDGGTDKNAVSPYWRRVIEENMPHLRSGDPDLIYPGEVIELPAVSDSR